jgi:hypothetical protein
MEGATEQLAVANEKITTLENELTVVVGQLDVAYESIINAELSLKEEVPASESSVPTAEHLQLVENLEVAGVAMTDLQSRISELECEIANARNDAGVSEGELIDLRKASEESSG